MKDVPSAIREKVRQRAHQRCERCFVPAPIGHVHHRRSRSVIDTHRHCPCNCVWLCPVCHIYVHAHPFEARGDGWIVSRHVDQPGTIPVTAPLGEQTMHCDGRFTLTALGGPKEQEQP